MPNSIEIVTRAAEHEPTLAGFNEKAAGFVAILTDIWTQFDGVGMIQQLGAIPA